MLIDCIQARGGIEILGILESDSNRWGESVQGIPVLGGDLLLSKMKSQGVKYFVVGVGNVGDASTRKRLYQMGVESGLVPLTVVHPTACRSAWARIGRGVQLLPVCVVNAGAEVGENAIINSGAIVEHDCVIGPHAHVATGARLASAVRVGDDSFVGIGASVRPGIQIGRRVVVGAGAVVVNDVPDDVIVVGVPARILRILGSARK